MKRKHQMINRSLQKSRARLLVAAIGSFSACALAEPAIAQTYNYTGPSTGFWAISTYWTLAGGSTNAVPGYNQNADLGVAGTGGTSVYFGNENYAGTPLANLTVGSANTGGAFQFVQNSASTMAVSVTENVSGSGAIFNQSAGTNTTPALSVGGSATFSGGAGTYLLSGTASLTSSNEVISGNLLNPSGPGYFNQSGGTNNLTFNNNPAVPYSGILVAGSGLFPSVYTMAGGAINLAANCDILLGNGNNSYAYVANPNYNPALFNQSGGLITFSQGSINVGLETDPLDGGNGEYILSGTGTISGTFSESIGYPGYGDNPEPGTFLQSGGLQSPSGIYLALGLGLYQQSGGTNNVGTSIAVGGEYDLSGGLLSVSANMTLSGNSSTPGLVTISGTGVLNITGGALQVGTSGSGLVIQSGGTANLSTLQIGNNSSGTYLLSGNGILNSTGIESIGASGAGLFQQSGGTHTAKGTVYIGTSSTGYGSYQLSGGTFNASGTVNVGVAAAGSYIQTGGNATIATLIFGSGSSLAPTSFATGLLQGGSLTVNNMSLNYYAGSISSFVMTGGTLALNNSCFINQGATFNQSGGTINGPLINSGQFIFYGGSINGSFLNYETATFNNQVYIGGNLTNIGTITLATGVLGTATGQTFLNEGQINIAGGAIESNGPVINNATISVQGTLILNGGMTNNGLIDQSNGFVAFQIPGGQSLTNNGIVNLASGQTVSLAGSFNNSGSLSVNGAVMTGGTIANLVGGSLNGPGVILSAVSNVGSVFPGSATLNITSAWNNGGTVQLTAVTSTLTGGTITNSGSILGLGVVGSSVNNSSGTIQALGGTLNVQGSLTNPAGGTLAVSAGNELLVSSGLVTNLGLINLIGGTYDNGGHPLLNSGQITGYGALRTGGLTNAGLFTLSGTEPVGTTTVNGNVTNNAGYFINIRYQPAIFTGNIVNNGTITTYSTSVTFAGTYTGNNYISDPSTNIFQNTVTIVPGGTMTGGHGDTYWFLGGNMVNNGTFNNGGILLSSDNVTNAGSFTQTGAQNWSGGTLFSSTAGTAFFGTDAGGAGQNLNINVASGAVTFASTQHLASLTINTGGVVQVLGGGTGNRLVVLTPAFSDSGVLDLTGNVLDIQNGGGTQLAAANSLVAEGYNGGKWTGEGITSSTAAADSTHLTAVGVLLNSATSTTPIYTSFDGSPVALNDVLVKYTYYGDANLDGKVDGSDYSLIDNGYLNHLTGWYNGDFNYDGVVDGSDYTLIDNSYNSQGAQLTAEVASSATAIAAVPEPGLLAVGIIGCVGMLGRRRRVIQH